MSKQLSLSFVFVERLLVLPQKSAPVFDLVWFPSMKRERDFERDVWFWPTPQAAQQHARDFLGLEARIHPLCEVAQLRMDWGGVREFYSADEWPSLPGEGVASEPDGSSNTVRNSH